MLEVSAQTVVIVICFVSFLKEKNIRLQGYIWKEQQCNVFQTNSN